MKCYRDISRGPDSEEEYERFISRWMEEKKKNVVNAWGRISKN